jgi:hypothetical protein
MDMQFDIASSRIYWRASDTLYGSRKCGGFLFGQTPAYSRRCEKTGLGVDPSLVPFNFSSGIEEIDNQHIMIDPLGIAQTARRPSSVCICESCQKSLKNNARPPELLAHFRWVGPVPPELQGLTWIEELLIARAHLNGTIVRLQNRNSHFGLKGHAILLLQDTTRLLDILPLPPSVLPDIVRVVWVGRPVRSADSLYDHFSVQTQRL